MPQPPLDPRTVRALEKKLLNAIAHTVIDMGLKRLPLLPNHATFEMMAKAAAAVYEAAVANQSWDE